MARSRDLPLSIGAGLQTAREILATDRALVEQGVIDTEAEQIVAGAWRQVRGEELSRVELFSRMRDRLPEAVALRILDIAGARAQGRPLQYVLGLQRFMEHDYEVGPGVLVPRPETEFLVDQSMLELRQWENRRGAPIRRGIEIGTGSGAISIELISAFPGLRMVATELTAEARGYASRNARRVLGEDSADRLTLVPVPLATEVFEPLAAHRSPLADFLISNPPYLLGPEEAEAGVDRHEPATALYAPAGDPLYFYRKIVEEGSAWLAPDARVLLEVAAPRAAETLALFAGDGWRARLLDDLAGRPRVIIAERLVR